MKHNQHQFFRNERSGRRHSYLFSFGFLLLLQISAFANDRAEKSVAKLSEAGIFYPGKMHRDTYKSSRKVQNSSVQSFYADRVVTGRVLNENGEPVAGTQVKQKGTTQIVLTDGDGKFSIAVKGSGTAALEFSNVSFENKELLLTEQANYEVRLTLKANVLENVTVTVGYGSSKKKDLTGSVATVQSKDFLPGVTSGPEQLILGKVPGVQIVTNGGSPGSGSTIRIRGLSSLNASQDPLIVIDGVPLDNSGVSGTSNQLSMINPDDIETFVVLKDASAAAIYGSRASNGVIIITTKRGESGKRTHIRFSSTTGLQHIGKRIQVLSAPDFSSIVKANGNAAQTALLGAANTNWQNEIFESAISSENNLSVSSNVWNIPVRLSLGFLNQEGVLKTDQLKRKNISLAAEPYFFDRHLKLSFNIKYAQNQHDFADHGAIGAAVGFDPTQSVLSKTPNLFRGYFEWDPTNVTTPKNPVGLLTGRSSVSDVQRLISNIQLDYKLHFFKDVNAVINLGYDYSKSDGSNLIPKEAASRYTYAGLITEYSQTKKNKLLDAYLNYTKNITSLKSTINLMVGYTYQDIFRGAPGVVDRNAAGQPTNLGRSIADSATNTMLSYYARLNYSLSNTYLLTASIRRDGSSKFSPNTRWGVFPSIALAWRVSEEDWLKSSSVVSDLKLRIGYGITGQKDGIGDYAYLPNYTISNSGAQYQFGNNFYPTFRPEGYDPNLKWETTVSYNAGVDFAFFNGKLSGSIDAYKKKTQDMLVFVPVPAGSNLSNFITTNVGNMENKGVEISLSSQLVNRKSLKWTLGANMTLQNIAITKLSDIADPSSPGILTGAISGGRGNTIQVHRIGAAPYSFYTYQQVYDSKGKPVEGVYVDHKKDGLLNQADRSLYKSPFPSMLAGLNSQAEFGQWVCGFSLRGSFGNYVYNNVNAAMGNLNAALFSNNFLGNMSQDYLNTRFRNAQFWSDYYIENASFIRLDNISVSYNLGSIVHKSTNLRVGVNAQNLFVITKYSGVDPEVYSGIDNNIYPRPRIFSLSLNLDLK